MRSGITLVAVSSVIMLVFVGVYAWQGASDRGALVDEESARPLRAVGERKTPVLSSPPSNPGVSRPDDGDSGEDPVAPLRPAPPPLSFDDYDEREEPSRELVRHAIEVAVADRFTSHRLSSDEVERATDALVMLRETQEALRELPMGRETATERRILVERIGEASSRFYEVLDMDPAEFTREASPSTGIDRFDPNEPIPEPELLERRS